MAFNLTSDICEIILKNIYKNTNGFNLYTGKYFKDYFNTTYLKEDFIQKWFNFIKSI